MNITAAVVESKGAPFAHRELSLGELRADEVLVEVAASGICHTDLTCRDQLIPTPLPAVLGHEGAGVVVEVGESVTKVSPGDRVGMTFTACGECPSCLRAKSAYCHQFFECNFAASRRVDGSSAFGDVGAHFFGQSSFATHSVASERNVVKLPDGISLEVAAPFGCGIQTGAGAVLRSFDAPAGSSLAVFGVGTVGLASVLGGVIAGCSPIVAVDVVPERLAVARELGATHVVDAREEDAVERIREATGCGVDFAIEATGSPQVLRACVDATAPCGVTGVIGAPAFGTEVSLDVTTVLTGGRVVRGVVEGDSVPEEFLPYLYSLYADGRFPVDRLMTFYEFDEIEQAAHDAESGSVIKAVLRMH
ncbi:MAG TPA: NAD(P)-dependent alcohol dehydrogenase [Gaiellaceae bacterium]|nr:NAD(P)-dependent alcohol dehydrogenase [Gaiellaceae bacterium]